MRIALLGDIALFGRNTLRSGYDPGRFSAVREILSGCDRVVGNLETPLTDAVKTAGGKSAYLKGSPEDVAILRDLGVTHVSLANNHMFDYRERGLADTISCLDSAGIEWFGVNGRQAVLECGVMLMGYCCYSTNAAGLEKPEPYVDLLDPAAMSGDIEKAAADGFLPVLSCHWGEEHVHYPCYDHVRIARDLASKHPVVIHGHHPHVIQGFETVGPSLIHYSLGNFCFDDVYTPKSSEPLVRLSRDNTESYVLILDVESGRLTGSETVPFSFEGGDYVTDAEILVRMDEWSSHLTDSEEEYVSMRDRLLSDYLSSRKKQRDLAWYLSRLNMESVRMILSARRNSQRYRDIIING